MEVHHRRFIRRLYGICKLEEEIDTSLKIEKNMGILELVTKYKEENIREESKEEGIELVLKITELHKEGVSIKDIAKEFNLKEKRVQTIINRLS